ncbi:MAG: hypothetical protein WC714_09315 [Candidatus Obscuribacterales bacterium]|jgi:hypothetical protein
MPRAEANVDEDNSSDNIKSSERCVKSDEVKDASTLFERVFGDSHKIYSKKIVDSGEQEKVEATQQVHVLRSGSGISTSGWAASQFSVDGKTYDSEHKGRNLRFSEQGKRPIDDVDSAEYLKLKSAYEQVSKDFHTLPKCTIY